MRNRMYGGVRGRKTKVGRKLLRFPPTRFSNYSGDIVVPETVTYEEVTYNVTSIGLRAFSASLNLTSVVIPNSVTTIGDNVFEQSRQLTSVTIGNGVISIGCNAFQDCSALTSITIPKSVTSIGDEILLRCSALTSIVVESENPNYDSRDNCNALIETASNTLINGCKNTVIPNGVKVIAGSAFSYCSSLTSVTIPNSVTSIGNRAFIGCSGLTSVTIPNSVISIGEFAFSWCSGMTSLGLGSGLTTIGSNAFYGCSGFTSVTIPASVLSIGEGALAGCIGLQSIQVESGNTKYDSRNNCNAIIETANNNLIIGCNKSVIPSSVTSIGKDAFKGCNELTSVTIASGITSIGEGAFSGCISLTSIVVEAGNTVYDSRDNCNALIETTTGLLVAGCNNSVIPDGVKTIGAGAFSGCKDLTSISIPNSVTTIEQSAFSGCGLTSVTIPNSVNSIGKYAFQRCGSLSSLSIGINVTTINECAFDDCSSLTSITIPNSVATIGSEAFMNCGNVTTITIGSGIKSLGYLAFNTYKLTDVYCLAENLPTDNGAFTYSGIGNATLHVPASSVDAYKAATPWSRFNEVKAIETKKTINVETVGTLSTLIPETEKYLIEDLTLTGNLNGDDLALIRDMAGNNINGQLTDGRLATLDLSGASIVDGGTYAQFTEEKYYIDANHSVSIKNTDPYTSQANVFREFLFAGCGALETITLPNTLNSISHSSTFSHCKKLTTINIPASVGNLCPGFIECPSLSSVIIDPNNVKYESPNNNIIIDKESHALITGCKNAVIHADKGITSISNYAFLGRIGETTMEIPEGITSIGDYAFAQTDLTSVVLPSTLVTIDNRAFQGCNKLTGIVLPASVETIGDNAFSQCSSLKTVTSQIVDPSTVTVGNNAFAYSGIDLIVPVGSVSAYKAAEPWNKFKEILSGSDTKYTLIYKVDGEVYQTYELLEGATITPEPAPTKEGYTFSGWSEIPETMPAEDVTVTGTFTLQTTEDVIIITNAGQTTWCSAYDLDFTSIEGIKAYTAGGYDRVSGTIWLMRVNQVPAKEGILIMGTPGEYHVPHKSTGTYYANLMVGTIQPITIYETDGDYTNYYLSSGDSGVGFYKVNGSVDLKANRAYLPLLKGTTQAGTRFIGLGFEDDGTTNLTPALSKGEGEGEWDTLQGQRVAKPGKGLCIHNGKKVVIK